ncbi:MAG TPA: glycosyltransferase family 2 protein [Candidatus Dormibacteraeota bacterium]|nr:glycosyltransferase family 2 protein [Candidatus Dormibacteraeota bacterium]
MIDRTVSVVIPCFNEAENIPNAHRRVGDVLRQVAARYEIVFVDNGSTDSSARLLAEIAAGDDHVSVLSLSRNFGAQAAYSAGLDYASGDCAIIVDGDLQDPPELIPQMIARWQEGYEVVYGRRTRRRAGIFVRAASSVFYRLFRNLAYVEMPVDAGEFGLMDRRVLDVLSAMPERNRFIRGLRAWAGFRQTGVPYVRDPRTAGQSSNSITDLFRWATTGLVSFSYAPLEWISALAIFVTGMSAVAAVVYVGLYFAYPNASRGFSTLVVLVLFLGGIQLLCLSIIGSYLAKIFEEIKARPKYIVDRVTNDHRDPSTEAALHRAAPARDGARPDGGR